MRSIIRRLVPNSFKQDMKIRIGAPHMFWSIRNLRDNGLKAENIIDIGAYKGEWTDDVLKIYPNASYLLLEGNPAREADLKKFMIAHPKHKLSYQIALLGEKPNEEKQFNILDTASSVLEEHNAPSNVQATLQLKTKCLDDICADRKISKVDLMKLDVQGYELEILKGGKRVLQNTQAVLMEVSLLDIHKGVPLIREVINFMYEYDFVVYDICSVSARRPLDKALWQTDLLFVKEVSVFRQNKSY